MHKKIDTTRILEDVVKKTSADKISINDLMVAMDSGGFGVVIMIFSLPIIVPLPPPIPSLISIPLLIFAFQMFLGYKSPRLPKFLSNFKVKRSILAILAEKTTRYLMKAEKVLKPRMFFLSSGIFERINGVLIFIFSISILVPLPFTNFLPGIGIIIISLGLISKDGLIILLGATVGWFGSMITLITIFVGIEVLYVLKDLVIGFFTF